MVAIANQKGGVGKTTTAMNTAAALALAGRRVLVIDLDPQGNLSTGLGVSARARRRGTFHLLLGEATLDQAIVASSTPGLDLVAADDDLAGAEIELVGQDRREHCLADAFRRDDRARSYDVILIDCPPSLGLLTLNGLVAARSVLVPLQCEFFALEGTGQLLRTVQAVRRHLNRQLRLEGIVLTMYDRRNNLSDLVAADARGFFGDDVFRTTIPRNIRLSEAPSHGRSAVSYDPRSSGALAYMEFAAELQDRWRTTRP